MHAYEWYIKRDPTLALTKWFFENHLSRLTRESISDCLHIFWARSRLHPTTIGFAEQTMQDYRVLDCHTETTLIMETTVPLMHWTLPLKTTLLHWTLLSSGKSLDNKENAPIPVDDLGIYSELDHQRLQDLTPLFSKIILQVRSIIMPILRL
jgi:hypothetical protein